MKPDFFGYYPPTPTDYRTLWSGGIIVPDTNVLLDLYRLPDTAREELFNVLEALKERLWIPHQVALEFQRRRLSVISAAKKPAQDALESAKQMIQTLSSKVESLQIEKRGMDIDPRSLLDDLKATNDKLISIIEAVGTSQAEITTKDPIRDRLDLIFDGKVGLSPSTQAELDLLCEQGDRRFDQKIPPGFSDADKDKNPNEASYVYDGLTYVRKFGDLILWRQLIEHVKEKGIKSVILVTGDNKDDWWWREQGKTMGPHVELSREIRREADVELFWMYSPPQFVKQAPEYTSATVSSQSVVELQELLETSPRALRERHTPQWRQTGWFSESPLAEHSHVVSSYESAVFEWLRQSVDSVEQNPLGFPDFIAESNGSRRGYEVKYQTRFANANFTPTVVNGVLRGYLEINTSRLSSFTMIVVVPFEDIGHCTEDEKNFIQSRSESFIKKYPISGLIIGCIDDRKFVPVILVDNENPFE